MKKILLLTFLLLGIMSTVSWQLYTLDFQGNLMNGGGYLSTTKLINFINGNGANSFWGGFTTLTGVTLWIPKSITAGVNTFSCSTQIQGMYYNAKRGLRLFPIDENTRSSLMISDAGWSYNLLSLTWGLYTNCTGVNLPLDPNAVYGQVSWTYQGQTGALIAGFQMSTANNTYNVNVFSTGLQFVPTGSTGFVYGEIWDSLAGVGQVSGSYTPPPASCVIGSLPGVGSGTQWNITFINPVVANQNFVKGTNQCGYDCINNYTGSQCEIAPVYICTGTVPWPNSTINPATGFNQFHIKDAPGACGYVCTNSYTGALCEVAPVAPPAPPAPVVSYGGGWGGGSRVESDTCPQGDFSPSYYDGRCNGDTQVTDAIKNYVAVNSMTHSAAPDVKKVFDTFVSTYQKDKVRLGRNLINLKEISVKLRDSLTWSKQQLMTELIGLIDTKTSSDSVLSYIKTTADDRKNQWWYCNQKVIRNDLQVSTHQAPNGKDFNIWSNSYGLVSPDISPAINCFKDRNTLVGYINRRNKWSFASAPEKPLAKDPVKPAVISSSNDFDDNAINLSSTPVKPAVVSPIFDFSAFFDE